MARNNRPVIIVAALLGLLAIGGTLALLFGGRGPQPGGPGQPPPVDATPKVAVYKALNDIPPRTRLTPEMFAQTEVDKPEAGAITDPSEVEGRISNSPIYKNETLTATKTIEGVRRVIPANFEIPLNTRAVAIWVNPDQTAAGLVDVGDRVDVIATHKFTLEAPKNFRVVGAKETTTGRVVGQDLLVLAVDKSLNAPPPTPTPAPGAAAIPGAAGAPGAPGAPAPGATSPPANRPAEGAPNQEVRTRVVLAATPDVAGRLVAAQEQGKLHITIRNPRNRGGLPVPEVSEYPSRTVYSPDPQELAAAADRRRQQARAERREDREAQRSLEIARMTSRASSPGPSVSPFIPAPAPSNQGSTVVQAPAPGLFPVQENEVTVIRGTEKTRVIVPR